MPGTKAAFWNGAPVSITDAASAAAAFATLEGNTTGVVASTAMPSVFHTTTDKQLVLAPGVTGANGFTVRWKAYFNPTADGDVEFKVKVSEGSKVAIKANKVNIGFYTGPAGPAMSWVNPVPVPQTAPAGDTKFVAYGCKANTPIELDVIYQRVADPADPTLEYYGFELHPNGALAVSSQFGYRD